MYVWRQIVRHNVVWLETLFSISWKIFRYFPAFCFLRRCGQDSNHVFEVDSNAYFEFLLPKQGVPSNRYRDCWSGIKLQHAACSAFCQSRPNPDHQLLRHLVRASRSNYVSHSLHHCPVRWPSSKHKKGVTGHEQRRKVWDLQEWDDGQVCYGSGSQTCKARPKSEFNEHLTAKAWNIEKMFFTCLGSETVTNYTLLQRS